MATPSLISTSWFCDKIALLTRSLDSSGKRDEISHLAHSILGNTTISKEFFLADVCDTRLWGAENGEYDIWLIGGDGVIPTGELRSSGGDSQLSCSYARLITNSFSETLVLAVALVLDEHGCVMEPYSSPMYITAPHSTVLGLLNGVWSFMPYMRGTNKCCVSVQWHSVSFMRVIRIIAHICHRAAGWCSLTSAIQISSWLWSILVWRSWSKDRNFCEINARFRWVDSI